MKPLRARVSEAKYNRILSLPNVKVSIPVDHHFLVQFELPNSIVDGMINVHVADWPWAYWKHPITNKKYRIAVTSTRKLIDVNSKNSNSRDWELIYLEWYWRRSSRWENSKFKQLPSWRMKKFDKLTEGYKNLLKSYME